MPGSFIRINWERHWFIYSSCVRPLASLFDPLKVNRRDDDKVDTDDHRLGEEPPPQRPASCDLVGPAHPTSNLRRFRFYEPINESPLHRRYRLLRQETQDWNNRFWHDHNTSFAKVCRCQQPVADKDIIRRRFLLNFAVSGFGKKILRNRWFETALTASVFGPKIGQNHQIVM